MDIDHPRFSSYGLAERLLKQFQKDPAQYWNNRNIFSIKVIITCMENKKNFYNRKKAELSQSLVKRVDANYERLLCYQQIIGQSDRDPYLNYKVKRAIADWHSSMATVFESEKNDSEALLRKILCNNLAEMTIKEANRIKEELTTELRVRKKLAAIKNCKIEDIEQNEIKQFLMQEKETMASENMQSLLEEEAAEKSKKSKQKCQKKDRGKKGKISRGKKEELSLPSRSTSLSVKNGSQSDLALQRRCDLSFLLQKAHSPYPVHARVFSRWQSKDISTLKKLTDTNTSNERVQKYASLSDEDLLGMRAWHYFPHLDQLLAIEDVKNQYSFKTTTGVGLLCSFKKDRNAEPIFGKVCFGVRNNMIIHCMFEPVAKIEDIVAPSSIPESIAEDETFTPVSQTTFEMQENGDIKVVFKDESHFLLIHKT